MHGNGLNPRPTQTGYSLVLLVIVVLFFAVGMLVISRGRQGIESQVQQSANAPAGLGKIEVALRNFAASQKRLPCPANPLNSAGTEALGATPDTCSNLDGVVPWATIGLTSADALDTWNRKVSYRVYAGATGFTQPSGLDATNCNTSASLAVGAGLGVIGECKDFHETRYSDFLAGKGVFVNDRGSLVSGVAFILISHGPSAYGSFGNDWENPRSTPPNASSKEYPNTLAPADNTYWKQDKSDATVAPDAAAHFDDVVYYKLASDLLKEANLGGRDWGTVSVEKTFSPPNVTTGATTRLTITLTSTIPNVSMLDMDLVDNFPTNLVVAAAPNTFTDCQDGTIDAVAGNLKVTIKKGAKIPSVSAGGTCLARVDVTPTLPVAMGAAPISYSNKIDEHALEVTPNLSATASPDPAAVRNINASQMQILTATPPPPIVTPSAGSGGTISPNVSQPVNLNSTTSFAVIPNSGYTASVAGTCGGTLNGSTYTTNPIVSNCTVVATFLPPAFSNTLNRNSIGAATGTTITANDTGFNSIVFSAYTLSAFADPPNLRNVSAASGGGIGAIVPGANSGTSLTNSNNEGLRFLFNSSYRYLGVTLLNFSTGSGNAEEQVMLTFYDLNNNFITQVTKQSCRTSPTTTNFTFDAGAFYGRVDIQARAVTTNALASSSFLLGGITACATGTQAACAVSGSSAANDCP